MRNRPRWGLLVRELARASTSPHKIDALIGAAACVAPGNAALRSLTAPVKCGSSPCLKRRSITFDCRDRNDTPATWSFHRLKFLQENERQGLASRQAETASCLWHAKRLFHLTQSYPPSSSSSRRGGQIHRTIRPMAPSRVSACSDWRQRAARSWSIWLFRVCWSITWT